MDKLGLSTATITETQGGFLVHYLNSGSFLMGEQWFAEERDAREFCDQRELIITKVTYR